MRIVKQNSLLNLVYSTGVNYPAPANLTYFWNFGIFALVCLAVQIVTGIVLIMHYVPNVELVFSSVEHIMRDVNYGWLLRYIHANGASMFFIVVYIHIMRGLYYDSYIYPREFLLFTLKTILYISIFIFFCWNYKDMFDIVILYGYIKFKVVFVNILFSLLLLGFFFFNYKVKYKNKVLNQIFPILMGFGLFLVRKSLLVEEIYLYQLALFSLGLIVFLKISPHLYKATLYYITETTKLIFRKRKNGKKPESFFEKMVRYILSIAMYIESFLRALIFRISVFYDYKKKGSFYKIVQILRKLFWKWNEILVYICKVIMPEKSEENFTNERFLYLSLYSLYVIVAFHYNILESTQENPLIMNILVIVCPLFFFFYFPYRVLYILEPVYLNYDAIEPKLEEKGFLESILFFKTSNALLMPVPGLSQVVKAVITNPEAMSLLKVTTVGVGILVGIDIVMKHSAHYIEAKEKTIRTQIKANQGYYDVPKSERIKDIPQKRLDSSSSGSNVAKPKGWFFGWYKK